jgi:hypothetical protein
MFHPSTIARRFFARTSRPGLSRKFQLESLESRLVLSPGFGLGNVKSIVENLIATNDHPALSRGAQDSPHELKGNGPALPALKTELASIDTPILSAVDQILNSLSPFTLESAEKPQPPGKAFGRIGIAPHPQNFPTVQAPPDDDAGANAPQGNADKSTGPAVGNSQANNSPGNQDDAQPNSSPGQSKGDKSAHDDKDSGSSKSAGDQSNGGNSANQGGQGGNTGSGGVDGASGDHGNSDSQPRRVGQMDGSGQNSASNDQGSDGGGAGDSAYMPGNDGAESLTSRQQGEAALPNSGEPLAEPNIESQAAWQKDAGATGGMVGIRLASAGTLLTAGLKGSHGSSDVTTQMSETAREVTRLDAASAREVGASDQAPAEDLTETLADPLQTVKVSSSPFDITENWHELLVNARAAGDELVELASHSRPAYWMASAVVLLVAVEMVRLQRERSSKQMPATAWPQIVAPSGLA